MQGHIGVELYLNLNCFPSDPIVGAFEDELLHFNSQFCRQGILSLTYATIELIHRLHFNSTMKINEMFQRPQRHVRRTVLLSIFYQT